MTDLPFKLSVHHPDERWEGNPDSEILVPASRVEELQAEVDRLVALNYTPTAMNCHPAWAGEHLETFAYTLAGALSSVMLPPDREMPTEEIREVIERISSTGPTSALGED